MNWELILLLTGLTFFAHWFNYIMGSPMAEKPDDVRPREILFGLPYWLATRRLKMNGLFQVIRARQIDEILLTSDLRTLHNLKIDHRRDLYIAGRDFFTWEKSLLCPICFHWWLSVFVGVFLVIFNQIGARHDIPLAALTYLLNHFIIRKIS